MFFCEKCDNMYYIKIGDETESNQLIYYCRNCGHENKDLNNSNICVSKTIVNGSGTAENMSHFINEYTKYDPTLPHSHTIKCPNDRCLSNEKDGAMSDVIYMRIDEVNMKYMYLCVYCNTNWMP